ncbi:hypothetical protein E4L96_20180 [Massilia arenosa]|uniref:Efflux transporter periplasmic adaptor subunit n=1 Tax=Zemynaea arenosa TaxID=2561931 RepID=A0A4Y9S060_9BURK|nr:hypothetical protein [Massilia arenosa]TFW13416.1 hypothetical protein E4L96_20180 [Massilia arenosa]
MKTLKNLEGLFLVAATLTVVATYASAAVPVAPHVAKAPVVQKIDTSIPTVVVHAKRLSAAE